MNNLPTSSQPSGTNQTCPVCQSSAVRCFFAVQQIPVLTNVLWPDQLKALSTGRGDIQLGFCENCGHIYNQSFDPEKMAYGAEYENSLHFSPRFQEYAESLAAELANRHGLRGKKIVEIGSGKGDFLNLLCQAGQNQGVGFDPSYDGAGSPFENIRFVPEYFSEQHASEEADFICSRHTLEHIPEPARFTKMLKRALQKRPATPVFVEVPNVRYTLNELAIWDLIYEHISYFSAPSLTCLFERGGFEVQRVSETFEGQFLTLEAALAPGEGHSRSASSPESVDELKRSVESFSKRFAEKTTLWRARLDEIRSTGKKAVLWGAGSKGISFLNFLKVKDEIRYVVDINPRKRGMFISGSGQEIVPPAVLSEYQPDTVIIMNSIYRAEIEQSLNELGVKAEILAA